MSPFVLTAWICGGTIIACVLACVVLGFVRSHALVSVKLTALDPDQEPRDHDVPLFRKTEALPDYQLLVIRREGGSVNLGTRPNTSAKDGLVWELTEPVSTVEIATLRLQDQDKLVSDVVAEVPLAGEPVEEGNYRFEFTTRRSFAAGVDSFFQTPVGMAIKGAFFLAVFICIVGLLLSVFQG